MPLNHTSNTNGGEPEKRVGEGESSTGRIIGLAENRVNTLDQWRRAIALFKVVVPFPSGALAREEHGRFG